MIKIVGDINFADSFFDVGFGVGSSIKKGYNPFSKLIRSDDDFWIGNFECVCSDTSNRRGSHAKQFRISPDNLSHVKHLNLYTVANNHVMQHGDKAFYEMLHYFESNNIKYIGSKERKGITFTHQGKKIGIIAFSMRPDNFTKEPLYWSLPEYLEICYELSSISNCDCKIVMVHWGNEFINYPYIDQKALAHYLIDVGADLVIGMHPHVLQGYEIYNGRHIFYSLGNCVFNMAWEPTKYSIVVNVDLTNDIDITYQYIKIENDYFPVMVENVPMAYSMKNLNALITESFENEIYYKHVFAKTRDYRKANRRDIAKHIHRMNFKDTMTMISDFLKRRVI